MAISLRLHTDPAVPLEEPIAGLLGRLLSAATAIIDEYSGDATPVDVCDQAAIELVGYWYDKPTFTRMPAYSVQKFRSTINAVVLAGHIGGGYLMRFWNRGDRREHREDVTALALEGLVAKTGLSTPEAQALAVIESCVSLISDPFLQATVEGFPIRPRELHDIARDLLLTGNGVRLIELGAMIMAVRPATPILVTTWREHIATPQPIGTTPCRWLRPMETLSDVREPEA